MPEILYSICDSSYLLTGHFEKSYAHSCAATHHGSLLCRAGTDTSLGANSKLIELNFPTFQLNIPSPLQQEEVFFFLFFFKDLKQSHL